MKYIIRIVSIIGLISVSQLAYPDSITDTYNTGDTLTATMMNNIKSAVNDNDTRITTNSADITTNASGVSTNVSNITSNETRIEALESVKSIKAVDANGLVIGELISIDAKYGTHFNVFTSQEYLEVNIPMTPDFNNEYTLLRFLTTDCTGAAYTIYPNGTVYLVSPPGGVYVKYYTPKSSVAQNVTVQSYTVGLGPCTSDVRTLWMFSANQNVPAITGVADIMYTLPITFQRQ